MRDESENCSSRQSGFVFFIPVFFIPHPSSLISAFLVSFGMLAQPFIEFIFGRLALQFIAETAA